MSNAPNLVFDFSIPVSTFLASSVGDGTWSDIFVSKKKDQAGLEAPSSTIDEAAGEIWANAIDDFVITVYALNAGAERLEVVTSDATPETVKSLATLADGESVRIEIEVSASDGATKFLDGSMSGLIYRVAGVLGAINTTKIVDLAGFVTADFDLDLSDNTNVNAIVIGELATDIRWTIKVVRADRIQGP